MKAAAAILLSFSMSATIASAQAEEVAPVEIPSIRFVHRSCGYSFLYPEGWVVHEFKARPCSVSVEPVDLAERIRKDPELDLDPWSVSLDSGERGFDEAARKAGFERIPEEEARLAQWKTGAWVIRGRGGWPTLVDEIEVGELEGLAGEAETGCYSRSAGYIGAGCPSPIAFLTNRSRWVTIHARQLSPFKAMLESIRILPVTQPGQ